MGVVARSAGSAGGHDGGLMSAFEVRAGGELRVAGRTLTGPALVYGDVSEEHRERFAPGAFAPVPAVPLLLQHDQRMVIVEPGEYELTDTEQALSVQAELPEKAAALALVRRNALTGFSVAFRAREESRDGDVRVVERAALVEVSLVDRPSYDGSTAEVRRRGDRGGRLGTIRGKVLMGRRVDCRCGPGDCLEAVFLQGSMSGAINKDEVLAVVGDYANAIASKRKGGVRFWTGRDGSLEYAVDIPNTDRGRALIDTMTSVPVLARPVLDMDVSDYTIVDKVATYRRAEVRALTIGPSDADKGWTALVLGKDGEGPEGRAAEDGDEDVEELLLERAPLRRRSLAWL